MCLLHYTRSRRKGCAKCALEGREIWQKVSQVDQGPGFKEISQNKIVKELEFIAMICK